MPSVSGSPARLCFKPWGAEQRLLPGRSNRENGENQKPNQETWFGFAMLAPNAWRQEGKENCAPSRTPADGQR